MELDSNPKLGQDSLQKRIKTFPKLSLKNKSLLVLILFQSYHQNYVVSKDKQYPAISLIAYFPKSFLFIRKQKAFSTEDGQTIIDT